MNMRGEYPEIPTVLSDGSYDRSEVRTYMLRAMAAGMKEHEIASHLRIPVHRAIYMINRVAESTRTSISEER